MKISFQLLDAVDYCTDTEPTCDSNLEILLPSGFPLFDLFSCISDHNGTPRVGAAQGQLHPTTTGLQYYCTSTHYIAPQAIHAPFLIPSLLSRTIHNTSIVTYLSIRYVVLYDAHPPLSHPNHLYRRPHTVQSWLTLARLSRHLSQL